MTMKFALAVLLARQTDAKDDYSLCRNRNQLQ
jgi:hypothetical protein